MICLSTIWPMNAVCMTRVLPSIIRTLSCDDRLIDQYDPNSSTPKSLPTGIYIYQPKYVANIQIITLSSLITLNKIIFRLSTSKQAATTIAMALINRQSEIVTPLINSYSFYLPVLWIPFVVVILFLRYFVRRYFSPLRDIPGPFLASISRVWKGAYPRT
jgi:hypothetical protein